MTESSFRPVQRPTLPAATRLSALARQAATKLFAPLYAALGTKQNADGEKVDPDVAVSLKMLELMPDGDAAEPSVEELRAFLEGQEVQGGLPGIKVGVVGEHTVRGVRVRHYRPEGGESLETNLPTVVFAHGGGWVHGSLDSYDPTCRYLCKHADVAVLSVDYRLAPEDPFPAGLDDVYSVLSACLSGEVEGVDAGRTAVAGDSAGANLAAAACLRLKAENHEQPALQLLFVPGMDLAYLDTASHAEFTSGFYIDRDTMEWYRSQYTPNESDRTNPLVSPRFAEDCAGLAPAYIAVAGFDPLRDDGIAYAEKLKAAGVHVTLRRHSGLPHPFVTSPRFWRGARTALDEAIGALRFALGVA